tara:strand:+ start:18456 stop:18977 length:522 start_codon:yes stop_codon:yes gene_type:complete
MENVVNLQARREERTRQRELASKEEIGIAFTLMSTNFINEDRLFAYGTFTPDTLLMIQDRMKSTGDIWRENKSLWYQSYTDSIVDIASVSVNDHESQQVYKDIGASGGRMVEIPARWYALKRHEIMDIEMITSPTSFSWRMKSRSDHRELHTAAFDSIDVGIIRASLLEEGDS